MSLKIKTAVLQDATSKAIKGVGKVGMLAITTAIYIEAKDGYLCLSTTNNVNTLTVKVPLDSDLEQNEFVACTDADLFNKLVSKTDSEYIELSITDGCLQFVGAGAYNLALIQDEEGNMGTIKPLNLSESATSFKLAKTDLYNIINYNGLSVSKTYEEILYTNYFLSTDKCITFNTVTACNSNIKLNAEIKALIPASVVNLLNVFTEPKVDVFIDNDKIAFKTEMIYITGMLCDGIDDYPVDALLELFNNAEYNKKVTVNSAMLRNCLDRLNLFTTTNTAISLNFTKTSLIIQNTDSTACEEIPYANPVEIEEYVNTCDIKDLLPVVSAANTDLVSLVFGYSQGFKVVFGNVDFVIPYSSDESEEA